MEAKHISKKLELNNRIECLAENTAFISLKDHKPNFQSSLPCRFINPSKSNIGKISKSILDKPNQDLRNKLQFNLWKNSGNVIDWFKKIENKNNYIFVKFDIVEYYQSMNLSFELQFALQKAMLNSQMKKKE